MKKWLLLVMALLAIGLLLSGCKAPEPETDEPTSEPPTQAPTATVFQPTPVPTVTPIVFEGVEVETPATPIRIDPVDRPPIKFTYVDKTNTALGITYKVPSNWVEGSYEGDGSKTVYYVEPEDQILSGLEVASSITITVVTRSSTQSKEDCDAYLDSMVEGMRDSFATLETSRHDDNVMMGESGRYLTYWAGVEVEGYEEPLRMRGRILVIPKDNKLYEVRYLCPADYNVGVEEGTGYYEVFKQVRGSIKEIE